MRLINKLFFLIVISLSPLVWANNIHYELDVTIDTQTQKLTGIVNVIVQHNAPYHLQLPITVYTAQGKTQHLVKISS